jgi:hypothetical protein
MTPWLYFSRPHNVAFHSLCIRMTAPLGTRSLLGLGLNFCPRPRNTTSRFDDNRFKRDFLTKVFFMGGQQNQIPKLFLRSNWCPQPHEIPQPFHSRVDSFLTEIKKLYKRKRCCSNLLPGQEILLRNLKHNADFIICKSDKNMGPVILERDTYIARALADHLHHTECYLRLSDEEASMKANETKQKIHRFLDIYFNGLRWRHPDGIFIRRSLELMTDPFAYFYLLIKIHKSPWKTRPIVSVSGSLLHGLGRWVDVQLQKINRTIHYNIKSSYVLKRYLCHTTRKFPPGAKFFSMDAVSMYTNIDTDHAMRVIGTYLRSREFPELDCSIHAILEGLRLVMSHNIFKFGDTTWLQLSGTAMGTPPAPSYATLYYYLYERTFIPHFPELHFYGRYIDDGLGIWVKKDGTDDQTDDLRWSLFQRCVNDFGRLEWEFTDRSESIEFLDLKLSFETDGNVKSIRSRLHEKALNLYLYLPYHSAHAPGVLKGLIYGNIQRIVRLSSDLLDVKALMRTFFRRLLERGYNKDDLIPIFHSAFENALKHKELNEERPNALFFHVPFHPKDPPSTAIQKIFRSKMKEPVDQPPIDQLMNRRNARCSINRLIVAYSRQCNIGNILAPRKLNCIGKKQVSEYIPDSNRTSH